MLSAGRVLIKPEGEYSPLKTYEMLDYVSYNGSSYVAKKTTTGNLPTNTEYWQLAASGAQSQNVTSNFAEVEGSDIASSPHAIDDVFVNKDGKLLKATLAISIGDTIVIDTNCEPTTVEDLISYLSTQVSTLDSSNKKLNGITEIAVQTDLHTLSLGEFYKDKTSFYVTNGPEEVDEVVSAIFRLTVESALDGLSTTRLLTLKTPGGKVYTQNYDGSSWGDWEQVAFGSEVELKQNIADNTLQTTSKTVPGAINELFLKSQTISNPNLLDNPWFTVNQRGKSVYSAVGYSADRWVRNAYNENGHKFTVGAIEIPYLKGDFYQIIEIATNHWRHVPYTVSAIIDGNLYSKTFTPYDDGQNHMGSAAWGSTSIGLDRLTWNIIENWSSTGHLIGINNNGASQDHTISAFKLELGSVSTLASDTAPNYATELLKCQRYCIALNPFKVSNMWFGSGFAYSATEVDVLVPVPVAMRANPSLVDATHLKLNDGTGFITPSFASIYRGAGVLKFVLTTAGMTIAHPYLLGVDNNDLMLVSADL